MPPALRLWPLASWQALLLLAIVAVSAIACGGGGGKKVGAPTGSKATAAQAATATTPAVEEGSGFVVQGVDPATLCLDVAALPSGFVLDGEGVRDNKSAAQSAPNPQQREQAYQTWGRVIGYFRQWAFRPPSSLTKEESSSLSKEEANAAEERAGQEILAAPLTVGTCTVDLYDDIQGAHQAFVVIADDLKNPPAGPGPEVKVDQGPHPDLGGESEAFVPHYGTVGRLGALSAYQILFRTHNVVGEVSVLASSGKDVASPAQDLARALLQRLQIQLKHRN